jgi:geranylgeranyl diphosphate synthase type I
LTDLSLRKLCEQADFTALVEHVSSQLASRLQWELADDDDVPQRLLSVTNAYPLRPGKGLRPLLCLIAAFAADGNPEDAWNVAVAIEMFHNWTLIHDDIIDHDTFRRGQPTAHILGAAIATDQLQLNIDKARELGLDLALLGGDLLQSRVFRLLSRPDALPSAVALDIINGFSSRLYPQLLAGEYADVEAAYLPWDVRAQVSVHDILEGKTGALMSFSAQAGAIIGAGKPLAENELAVSLGKFASLCGMAFQLEDDVLGLLGDEKQLGKPVGSDLREGKQTAILREAAHRLFPPQWHRLTAALGRPDATPAEIAGATSLLQECGAVDAVIAQEKELLTQADAILQETELSEAARSLLHAWKGKIIARNF